MKVAWDGQNKVAVRMETGAGLDVGEAEKVFKEALALALVENGIVWEVRAVRGLSSTTTSPCGPQTTVSVRLQNHLNASLAQSISL